MGHSREKGLEATSQTSPSGVECHRLQGPSVATSPKTIYTCPYIYELTRSGLLPLYPLRFVGTMRLCATIFSKSLPG